METAYTSKYTFIGEWYDNQAGLIRRFNIFYYLLDGAIEMFDLKNRKTFMKRYKVEGLALDNFYIGGTISILGRLIKIVDFGCDHTKQKLQEELQLVFVMIKPIETKTVAKIITHFNENGLRFSMIKLTVLTLDDFNFIYRKYLTAPIYPFLLKYLVDMQVYGVQLMGKNCVAKCHALLGDLDPLKAAPGTIRAMYGQDKVRNCAHVSATLEDALQDLEYFFPPPPSRLIRLRLTPTLSNCTLCIVKPHAVREGKLGKAIEIIDEGGFNITALNMFMVENVNASEFLEVYKGIVPEYQGMIEELSSGPCVAMEIVSKDKSLNTPSVFRKYVGPSDPEVARLLRPHTLRAQLGTTKIKNAIHCSDLPEDGLLEVEYFFKILEM